MLRTKPVDMTKGALLSSIAIYAFPIMLASLVQTLFNAADLAVLGNFSSTVSVAAVGATGPIVGLLVTSVIGLSNGTNVILSRAIGAGHTARAQRVVGSTVVLALAVGVLFGVIGIVCAPWMLTVTDCDASYMADAQLYLTLYFIGIPFIMLYNFGAAILRVSGDSQRPLVYMIACGGLNVVLNIVLCLILPQKVAAVAIATVASQLLGAVLVLWRLIRTEGVCRLDLRHLSFSFRELWQIVKVGIPSAFNTALYCISNLQIQAAINAFGPASTAGNAATAQIEGVAASFTTAIQASTLAFLGQNLGAGNRERVRKTFLYHLILGFSGGLVLGVGLYLLGVPLLDIFVPNDALAAETIRFGLVRMQHVLAIYFIAGLNGVLVAAVQAFGYPILPMINSIVTVLLFRVVWMSWIYPVLPTGPDPVQNSVNLYACYPWSWSLSLAVNILLFTVIYLRYRRGRLKTV